MTELFTIDAAVLADVVGGFARGGALPAAKPLPGDLVPPRGPSIPVYKPFPSRRIPAEFPPPPPLFVVHL